MNYIMRWRQTSSGGSRSTRSSRRSWPGGAQAVPREDEITIFDSSGTALQDVAAAVAVYEKARAAGRGTAVNLEG